MCFPLTTASNLVKKYTGCFKKSFTALKACINLLKGHVRCFELSQCSKTHRVLSGSYGSMRLLLVMQGVSKRDLQLYSKCYCVASVM
jgi:hypothetical protein